MRISLVSDMHIEHGDLNWDFPEVDVAVMAGDICLAATTSERLRMVTNQLLADVCASARHVVYVFGNHESYGLNISETKRRFYDTFDVPSNLVVLENEVFTVDDVDFWGATFWTDQHNGNPMAEMVIQNGMPDHKAIFDGECLFLARYAKERNDKSRESLYRFMDKKTNNKKVVVTHHAPSFQSSLPEYKHDPLTFGFCNTRLDFQLSYSDITYWMHGHTHNSSDYKLGETRVLCNPKGYPGHDLNPEWAPLVVEI